MDGLGLERWSTGVARRLRRLALEPLFCGCLEPVGLEGLAGFPMISGGQAGSIPSLSMCP